MSYQLIDQENLNQNYRGHAEKCIYTFEVWQPDQLGSSWTAHQMLEGHITELQQQGSILLEYKLYEDTSPTFTTKYKVELVASASPLWWNLIIIGVLAVLSILFISWVIQDVSDIVEYGGAGIGIGFGALGIAALIGVAVYAAGSFKRSRDNA